MNELAQKRTIASLQKIIAAATTPEKVRRACALRLSRLRAAATGSRVAKPLTITTRATPPPSAQACFEAVESFRALSLQRSALFRKRRTAAEQNIFLAMAALMPAAVPTNDDPKEWAAFIDRIDLLLSEIRSIKTL